MAFLDTNSDIWTALSVLAQDEGLVIYDIERVQDNSLRVFVEKPGRFAEQALEEDRQARISSEDCAKLCRRLMLFFELEGEGLGFSEPEIEVSSPGVNRRLRLDWHFRSACGERVKILSRAEPASCVGILRSVEDKTFSVLDEQSSKQVAFAFSDLKKANVDFKF